MKVKKMVSLITAMALTTCCLAGCSAFSASGETTTTQTQESKAAETTEDQKTETADPQLSMIPNYQNAEAELAAGPNGEQAVYANTISITDEQIEKVKSMNLKAALLWAGSSEWYNALTAGAEEEFKKMGIEIVANSDAQFDPSKQATDIETAMALSPDIILSLPVDPVSGTTVYQPAVDAGCKLLFADNSVNDYRAGDQYVATVTGDQYGIGRACAKQMAEAIGGSGKIGVIYYDVDYLVTNNRDNEFVRTIKKDYPDIEIVDMEGFTEENATGDVANAMIAKNTDLDGIFVSWDTAAEPVVSQLRANGMNDVKVVTIDLGGNNDLDMAQNGNVYAKVADMPFEEGQTMAILAALSILGEDTPEYVVSDTIVMTKDNMVEAYQQSLNKTPDDEILKALEAN